MPAMCRDIHSPKAQPFLKFNHLWIHDHTSMAGWIYKSSKNDSAKWNGWSCGIIKCISIFCLHPFSHHLHIFCTWLSYNSAVMAFFDVAKCNAVMNFNFFHNELQQKKYARFQNSRLFLQLLGYFPSQVCKETHCCHRCWKSWVVSNKVGFYHRQLY